MYTVYIMYDNGSDRSL